jgi:hypothetical protein
MEGHIATWQNPVAVSKNCDQDEDCIWHRNSLSGHTDRKERVELAVGFIGRTVTQNLHIPFRGMGERNPSVNPAPIAPIWNTVIQLNAPSDSDSRGAAGEPWNLAGIGALGQTKLQIYVSPIANVLHQPS